MSDLTHFDEHGSARMVDVGNKPTTHRIAIASGVVEMLPTTMQTICDRKIEKGDVLEIARIAGIMATKRTSDLIPLCHPLKIDSVEISFATSQTQLTISAKVVATDRTGVEMEALTAVSVTALTIYDMCKSIDRAMQIRNIQLEEKSGGKSGHYQRS